MNHRDAIMARLAEGAADRADLACALHVQCGVPTVEMYRQQYRTCENLIAEGVIEKHVSGCYILSAKAKFQPRDEVPKPKEPKGKFGNATVAPRLVPITNNKDKP